MPRANTHLGIWNLGARELERRNLGLEFVRLAWKDAENSTFLSHAENQDELLVIGRIEISVTSAVGGSIKA